MNQFKIKKVKASNFLCFGEDGFEVDFESFGNIILLQGRNLDNVSEKEEDQLCSNGVGKSSIGESIVYGITGKTVRKFKKNEQMINNKSGKKLCVEIWVDDLKIVRKISPTSLKVYDVSGEDPVDLTKGTMSETQALIESKLGFNSSHQSLINLLILTDNNSGSFLESDGPSKRKMVESYLELEQYAEYSKSASDALKEQKNRIKEIQKEYDVIEIYLEDSKSRYESDKELDSKWENDKKLELESLISKFKNKQNELANTDNGKALIEYENAQIQIKELNQNLSLKDSLIKNLYNELQSLKLNLTSLNDKKSSINNNLQIIKNKSINSKNQIEMNKSIIDNLDLQKCKKCGNFDEETSKKCQSIIDTEKSNIVCFEQEFKTILPELTTINSDISELNKNIEIKEKEYKNFQSEFDLMRNKVSNLLKINKPVNSVNEKIIEEQILELKNQILAKKSESDGDSPYITILDKDLKDIEKNKQSLEEKKKELDEVSSQLSYYEFWVKAFGEQGIRKFVIDGIIPSLNDRIHYWLNYLIDNKITLKFDNELNEKIERNPSDGEEFVYDAMSGGERRRLNLAVSQAFSYITTLATGSCPSLSFLDEVATNIDQVGVNNVYQMIKELSKERQILVTTHDKNLLDLLNADNCDVINLIKQNGVTKIN
jgi:DNA repair exonuclease SbcCD ATPase subunit